MFGNDWLDAFEIKEKQLRKEELEQQEKMKREANRKQIMDFILPTLLHAIPGSSIITDSQQE